MASGYMVTWIGDDSYTGREGGVVRHHGGQIFGPTELEKARSYAAHMAREAGVTYVVSVRHGGDDRGEEIERFNPAI